MLSPFGRICQILVLNLLKQTKQDFFYCQKSNKVTGTRKKRAGNSLGAPSGRAVEPQILRKVHDLSTID